MFHVKPEPDPRVAAEHYGDGRASDWRVEYRPDGSYWWVVTDWTGELVAHGIQASVGSAVNEAVRWSIGQRSA